MPFHSQRVFSNASYYASWLISVFLFVQSANAQPSLSQARPRIVITADPELDDNNSLIRLLYSSDLNIEGLVYASSKFHWEGDVKVTRSGQEIDPFWIERISGSSLRYGINRKSRQLKRVKPVAFPPAFVAS